jgi:type I restriction enzyme S subunit
VIDTAFYVEPQPEWVCWRFLFHLLRHVGLRDVVGDSAVPGLNRETAEGMPVGIPPTRLAAVFDSHVLLHERLALALVEQSATLKYTRDTLLPKLMSGELRVGEVGP